MRAPFPATSSSSSSLTPAGEKVLDVEDEDAPRVRIRLQGVDDAAPERGEKQCAIVAALDGVPRDEPFRAAQSQIAVCRAHPRNRDR